MYKCMLARCTKSNGLEKRKGLPLLHREIISLRCWYQWWCQIGSMSWWKSVIVGVGQASKQAASNVQGKNSTKTAICGTRKYNTVNTKISQLVPLSSQGVIKPRIASASTTAQSKSLLASRAAAKQSAKAKTTGAVNCGSNESAREQLRLNKTYSTHTQNIPDRKHCQIANPLQNRSQAAIVIPIKPSLPPSAKKRWHSAMESELEELTGQFEAIKQVELGFEGQHAGLKGKSIVTEHTGVPQSVTRQILQPIGKALAEPRLEPLSKLEAPNEIQSQPVVSFCFWHPSYLFSSTSTETKSSIARIAALSYCCKGNL